MTDSHAYDCRRCLTGIAAASAGALLARGGGPAPEHELERVYCGNRERFLTQCGALTTS